MTLMYVLLDVTTVHVYMDHCPRPVGTPYYVFVPDCPVTI